MPAAPAPTASYHRGVAMNALRRHVVDPLTRGRVLGRLALLVSGIPLGVAWFTLLVTGWSLGLGLAITLVGLPVLLGLAYAVRAGAELERRLLEVLTGVRAARPDRRLWRGGLLVTLRAAVTEAGLWREQADLLLRFVAGLPLAVLVLAVIGVGGHMPAAVTYYHVGDGIDLGAWTIDTLGEALAVLPAGLLVLALAVPLTNAAGALWIALARTVLGTEGSAAYRRSRRGRDRALAAHAGAHALVNVIVLVVWAGTTRAATSGRSGCCCPRA